MNKNKTLSGIIGLLIGYLVFILIVDAVSKPDNFNIAIKPVEFKPISSALFLQWVLPDGFWEVYFLSVF